MYLQIFFLRRPVAKWLSCLPLNPMVVGLSHTWGHDHDSSQDTSTGSALECNLSCENLSKLAKLLFSNNNNSSTNSFI